MRNKIMAILAMLISLNSCSQSKNTKKEMEEIVQEIHKQVHTYKEKPVYSTQVDKTGCRMVLEMKNNIEYRFTENNGESMNVPLNFFITKSGKQTAIIKVYPKEGDTYITKYAMANLTFYYAPDKGSKIDEYKEIAKYTLPEGLEEKKLPYYEALVTFDATIPFDYSKELENAQDLTKVSNIEQKIINKYSRTSEVIRDKDIIAYEKQNLFNNIRMFETTYEASIEEIRNNEIQLQDANMFSSILQNREMLPIENYKIQYYADGKIVALWNIINMESPLRIKANYTKKDGSIGNYQESISLFLYMPAGSNELKVW
jgi:hypothetical protein